MPVRQLPTSMPTCIRCLKMCRDEYKITTDILDRAVPEKIWLALDDSNPNSLLSVILAKASTVARMEAAYDQNVVQLKLAATELGTYCCDFHIVLDRGINRGAFPPGSRTFYGREVHATSIPYVGSQDALKEVAEAIIKGEADRAAAEGPGTPLTLDSSLHLDTGLHMDSTTGGYRAMDLPSAAEVAAVFARFETLRVAVENGHKALNKAQEALAQHLEPAKALSKDVYDYVEFFYRDDPDPASRRDKCAPWGLVYADSTTPPDPEPTPPTPPAPNP